MPVSMEVSQDEDHPELSRPSEALKDVAFYHCLGQTTGLAPQPFKGKEKHGSAQSIQRALDGGQLQVTNSSDKDSHCHKGSPS